MKHIAAIFASVISSLENASESEPVIEALYYPGWTKKAISFSLDDGNKTADSKIIPLLKNANMKATFNLSTHWLDFSDDEKKEEILKLYSGFEIANHVKYHPYPYYMYASEGNLTDFEGDDENGNTISLKKRTSGGYLADEAEYIKCVDAGHAELESIFGTGSVKGLVWPGPGYGNFYGLKNHVVDMYPISRQGANLTYAEFALPDSWVNWKYNADHTNIYERALEFEALELSDSDSLRWLCVGVHPADYFSNSESEINLSNMLELCKNRPDTYWYAANREIYDYTEALKKLKVISGCIVNSSDVTVYVEADGKKITVAPGVTVL